MLFVTGASGLLGSAVLLGAHDAGVSVAGQYWQHPLQIPGVTTHKINLRDHDSIRTTLELLRPEAIIHCAAATNVDWCEDHPQEAYEINARVSGILAETAHVLGARFVYISTDAVFDGEVGGYSESDSTSPLNTYAKSKLQGEREVLRVHPESLVMRVNIYGWNAQNKYSLAEWVLSELSAGKSVPGFIDVWFCPMLANDLAELIVAAIKRELRGVYHVSGSEKISKYDFARRVAETFEFYTDAVKPTRLADAKLRAPRSPDMSLDTSKIVHALGRQMPDVKSGLFRFRHLREGGYPQRVKSYVTGV